MWSFYGDMESEIKYYAVNCVFDQLNDAYDKIYNSNDSNIFLIYYNNQPLHT